ncbi:hypothetical protein L228DRAFT_245915 [Xylona heveae TC161]|uniref:Argonaute complex, subunit Arb1 n=1 Tax=Xylona heveae (strain CBS 132557 / TC161) TaxID=1328760 RepID=A0A165H9P1_XYLHT|nr:hypothetical protein L228DRAFT_245915 [Xylona heveae TC161]KZF23181.1 hypothetical protein L228DRAFT_245915 [Xylona heveae TC161]
MASESELQEPTLTSSGEMLSSTELANENTPGDAAEGNTPANVATAEPDQGPHGPDPAAEEQKDGVEVPKKKKKKSKRKANKPTGFEEYYVDAPITPAEFEEERGLYHPSRSFAERIETCIQRYKAKRNFDSERKNIFDKYMTLGGINATPKMFTGGLDSEFLEDRDAADIAAMTSASHVDPDKGSIGKDGSIWEVDFEGVAKGFLSSFVPGYFDLDTEKQIKACTAIIRNFLNYVLHHNVCPEYEDQIYAARRLCDLAEKELFMTRMATKLLPGRFNMANSTLYGGYFCGMYTGDKSWSDPSDDPAGMSDKEAKQTVMAGLAAYGTDEQIQVAAKGTPTVIKTEDVGFEIDEILYADTETKEFYGKQLKGGLPVLGKIRVKGWRNPSNPEEDMSDDEESGPQRQDPKYEFWVEEDVLKYCFEGMKIEATVRELDCGIKYFDTVTSVLCSFYTFLPNELMQGWKEPVPRGNNEDDNQAQGAMEGEDVE